jgi:cellulose synthase/poly-beta-1,6-N-acetylglucosamine synthase-like glycosyltransferase
VNWLAIISCILSIPLVLYSLYFVFLGLAAFKKSRNVIGSYAPQKRFAVLIAARNEEKVLPGLIDSLKRQEYPCRLYDIFVIPNNCTDNTLQTAADAGARILHIKMPVKTKGEILKQAFEILRPSGYDGYVIFDADNIVGLNFLKRMNDALCAGYHAAQGKRDSKNLKGNWISGCYTIYFGTINIFINRARMNLNRSANIYGTGYMVSTQLLAETGYPIKTLTEDMEYTMLCVLKDRRIVFVEDAVIYDEQPTTLMTSMRQRKRWTAGSYLCAHSYYSRLVSSAMKKSNKCALDVLLFALTPLFQVLLTVMPVITFFASVVGLGTAGVSQVFSWFGLISVVAGYLGQVLFSGIVLLMQGIKIRDNIAGILTFPIFLMSWIPINFYCLFKTDVGWEPIDHKHNVSILQLYDKSESSRISSYAKKLSRLRQGQ